MKLNRTTIEFEDPGRATANAPQRKSMNPATRSTLFFSYHQALCLPVMKLEISPLIFAISATSLRALPCLLSTLFARISF